MLLATWTNGAVVSTIFTRKVLDALLPALSLAEQVTLVLPSAKVLPLSRSHGAGRSPSTSSLALTPVQETDAPVAPVASASRLPGTVTIGTVWSCTLIVKDPLVLLPLASTAEQSTLVSPSANTVPEARLQLTVGDESATSVAVAAAKVATAPFGPVAETSWFGGVVSSGLVVSWTMTWNWLLPLLPATSL